jgi:hypothetical protein
LTQCREIQKLTIDDLSILSRVTTGSLRQEAQFGQIPRALQAIQQRYLRMLNESGLTYAKWLDELSRSGEKNAQVNGRALTVEELSISSETRQGDLRKDPRLRLRP